MTAATTSQSKALIAQATRALARDGISLADVLATLRGEDAVEVVERKAVARKIGGSVVPSDVERKALRVVLDKLAEIDVPEHPRELVSAEKRAINDAMEAVKKVKKFAERTEGKLVEMAHGHFDVVAEKEGRANGATPVNQHGYYLTEDKESMAVVGSDVKITRSVSEGSISVTARGLQALEARGKITHQDYLAMTEDIGREVNERKMLDHLAKHPELMAAIKPIIEKNSGNVSIRLSPNK